MRALYVRRGESAGEARVEAVRVAGWADEGADVRVFAGDASLMCFPYRADEIGHLLHPCRPGLFDAIYHHRSQPLFEGAWARAYLRQLHASLAPGGALTVPFELPRQAASRGTWSLDDLAALLGPPDAVHEEGACATFRRGDDLPPVASALAWYFREGARLAVDDLLVRPALRGADPETVRRLLGDLARPGTWPELTFRGAGADDMETVARKHSYWIGGLAAKCAVLRRIVRDRFDADRPLRHVDHGGGIGLLAAEMLLEPDAGVKRAVNCDVNVVNLVLGAPLHRFYRDRLAGRLHAHLGRAEDFPYDEPHDVVSFVGSLLYVPRGETPAALDRAWDALAPGGALVVHENIRADRHRGGADYDVMFERAELDALLGRFGPIDHYASTAAARLAPDRVGDKTVFRVVTKP